MNMLDNREEPIEDPKKKHGILAWLLALLGSGAYIYLGYYATFVMNRPVAEGCKYLLAAGIYFPLSFLAWTIGDAVRRFMSPDIIFERSAVDLATAKLFWIIGPQVIGVLLVFCGIGAGVLYWIDMTR